MTTTKKICLITGASTGIGFELARIFAREGFSLVLVAKDRDRLLEASRRLQQEYRREVLTIPADLSLPFAARELYNHLKRESVPIDVLVNNAGFGVHGRFAATEINTERDMIQTNISTLTELTKFFLADMIARGHGKILNVASTAGFQPGPYMAVYYATKAYVVSFSAALAAENRGTGITISALCPGPTKTEFQRRANISEAPVTGLTRMDAPAVAEAGFRGLQRGRTIIIPGFKNKLSIHIQRFIPRNFVTTLIKKYQERR